MDRIAKWLNDEVGCTYSRITNGYSNVPDSALLAVLADKDRIDWLSANMGTISGRKLTREEIDDAMSSNEKLSHGPANNQNA